MDLKSSGAVINTAFSTLPLDQFMISPHPDYLKLVGAIENDKSLDLAVLIPMPQVINKYVAENGFSRFIIKSTKDIMLVLLNLKMLVLVVGRFIKKPYFRYLGFYLYFLSLIRIIKNEMSLYNVNPRTICLHNLMTDIILASNNRIALAAFVDATLDSKVESVLITQNPVRLVEQLKREGIYHVTLCFSFNQLGYMVNPDLNSVIKMMSEEKTRFKFWAMQIIASGKIKVEDLDISIFDDFEAILVASKKLNRIEELVYAFENYK